ncbi:MAG TPA: glycosyltransferase, partial [Bryobacteraceae bacterium]|nr:glycosyltransferase [Bryobacteraceae bacterium]
MFWFWFFAGSALLLALLSLRGERRRAAYVAARLAESPPPHWPPVTVFVPVKGADEGLRENLEALSTLDYPDYELIITAAHAADIPPGVLPARAKIVLAHGEDPETGEKIQNLAAAVRAARKFTDVYAFADSDGRVAPGWLKALVQPLGEKGVGAVTGYRWYAPDPPDFWSLMRSVWNAPIAGTLGPGDNRFAWGGAMAISREVFQSAQVTAWWNQAVSDDYALSAAVHAAGLRIVFAPGAMVASTDHITASAFLRWARRQMLITRVCYPRLWWPALAAHVLYCGGMVAAILAAAWGHRGAEWILLAQLTPGMVKGMNRSALARLSLPGQQAWFRRHAWVHTWWVPLATWVWLIALIASAAGRTIEWRGRRYRLRPLASPSSAPPAS